MRRVVVAIALASMSLALLASPAAIAVVMHVDSAAAPAGKSATGKNTTGQAATTETATGRAATAEAATGKAAARKKAQTQTAAITSDPVIAAAGDIACAPGSSRTARKCHQQDTADLLAAGNYDAVLPLGDEQYPCGQLSAFNQVYDPTWGDFNNVARPIVGDNEYAGKGCSVPGAEGYFTYFGDRASPDQPGCTINCNGYYSYDIGAWHIVALNSECTQPGVGGCGANDPMGAWLDNDLEQHQNSCTLAYMHRPYWTNTGVANKYKPIVQRLYDGGVEVLLVGHNHIYTRHAPQDPNSNQDPEGVREFIVGTGGASHGGLSTTPLPNVQARDNTTFGVLELTLHPTSYDFRFVPDPTSGSFTDSGTNQPCFGGATPQAPTATTNPATNVTETGATLNGTVNPNGSETTYQFQYGTTTAYGNTTTPTSAGFGTSPVPAVANISGLSPATTYHYRVVATNSLGTAVGADRTFTTQSPGGGCTAGSLTATDVVDTFVYVGAPDKNFGGDPDMKVKSVGSSTNERTAFASFATPVIPSGCNVTGVTLTLVSGQVVTAQQSISVHEQDAATWTEMGLTWLNQPTRGSTIASDLTFNLQALGQQHNFSLPPGSWLKLGGTTSISITSPTSAPKLFATREQGASVAPVLRIDYA